MVYAFSISVNTVATGAVTDATNLSVGIVDEDGSELSRQIAEALLRSDVPARRADHASEIDAKMDHGELLFVVEIPPNFQANVLRASARPSTADQRRCNSGRAGRQRCQLSQDRDLQRDPELSNARASGRRAAPINLVVRAEFNPNLRTAWFSAMTQVINQITLLTVILTGAALIREREQGTVEHLLVMPVVPAEIMLAKMLPTVSSSWSPRCCRCNSSSTGGSARRLPGRFCCSCSARPSMPWWSRRWAFCSARSPPPWASSASWRCRF